MRPSKVQGNHPFKLQNNIHKYNSLWDRYKLRPKVEGQ